MRRIFLRSVVFCLLLALGIGGYAFVRAYGLYQSTVGGFEHIRYLLESGESIEGAEAEDVLSDSYLLSLFGDNPELVDRLKTVVDLGMATDANLKLGSVSAMVVTYRKDNAGEVKDAAIYAIGGFPDPKSKRLGFHSTGYLRQELSPELWLSGKSLMNLLGRDVIVFCEQDKAEEHMALLFDLLNGGILPLAERIVESPLYYAIVFPDPKELAPPNLRNNLQTVIIKGEMDADSGRTEIMLISPNYRTAKQVHTVVNDMAGLARITFHDKFGGYIKEVPWGTMNDTWWSVEYVALIDSLRISQDQVLVVASVDYDRIKNNAILKTIERAGRDLAMQKSFSLAGDLPWEFAFKERANPSGGYWSAPHRWGPEWPLGDEGIPTPGSIAAAEEREKAKAQKEAAAEEQRLKKMNTAPSAPTSGPST
jgi:hypothetical protein